jgi:hypothetical protein
MLTIFISQQVRSLVDTAPLIMPNEGYCQRNILETSVRELYHVARL